MLVFLSILVCLLCVQQTGSQHAKISDEAVILPAQYPTTYGHSKRLY